MSAQLGVDPAGPPEGDTLLLALLGAALVTGLILGWFLARTCHRQHSTAVPVTPAVVEGGWSSVVAKALRFIRKRRRIALAWANYRNHRLRQLPTIPAEPPLARQRSDSSEEVRPLREGPAISNGAQRRRAQPNRHLAGSL